MQSNFIPMFVDELKSFYLVDIDMTEYKVLVVLPGQKMMWLLGCLRGDQALGVRVSPSINATIISYLIFKYHI